MIRRKHRAADHIYMTGLKRAPADDKLQSMNNATNRREHKMLHDLNLVLTIAFGILAAVIFLGNAIQKIVTRNHEPPDSQSDVSSKDSKQ
jgi:hypothetical protein